jgi:NifB/MoaA-like Fe-S oxidoreductase
MFGCKVPGEGITYLEEVEIKEFLHSYTPWLTEEDLEQMTSLTERDDQEDSDAVVKRPHLPSSALKKGLQMADDLVSHIFEVNHFINRCLKIKHKMEAVTAHYNNA